MDKKHFWKKVLFSALVFLLSAAAYVGMEVHRRDRYPTLTFTDMSALGLSDTEFTDNGRFLAKGTDGFVELDGLNTCVQSVEVNCAWISRKPSFEPGTMQIYYNTGIGYNETESVRVKIKNGSCRAVFETKAPVRTIRFDLFDEPGNSVTVQSIVLNPPDRGNLPVIVGIGITFFAALCILALFDGIIAHAFLTAGTVVLLFASGLPVRFYNNPQIRWIYVLLALAGFAVLAVTAVMREGRRKEIVFTVLLMGLGFILYYTWAKISPIGQGPDEGMHYDVVNFVAKYHSLPRGDDPRIRNEIWGFSYAFSPILPFIIGAWFKNFAALFTDEPFDLLMAARMVSILSGCGTAFFVSRAAFMLFPKSKARYMLPVFVVLFPETAFMFTYVNSDGLAIMTTAMIFCFWVSGIRYSWRIRDGVGLSVAMGLCGLTYYNCYGFVLMSIPLFFFSIFRTKRDRAYILRLTAMIVILTAAICGWWFVRNAILYNGDFLGRKTLNATAEIYAMDAFKPSNISTPKSEGLSLSAMVFERGWLTDTFSSFICMFSHYVLPGRILTERIFKRYFAAGIAGAVLFAVMGIRGRRRRTDEEIRETVFRINTLFAGVIPIMLALIYSYSNDYQPQGRYVLPCIVPFGYFLSLGACTLDSLIRTGAGKIRARLRPGRTGAEDGSAEALTAGEPAEIVVWTGIAVSVSVMINVFLDIVFSYYV